jgi:hypothetical protein
MKSVYSDKIFKIINDLDHALPITLDSFSSKWSRNSVARVLSRLEKQGYLFRIRRGVYTKVKQTRFGPALPTALELLAHEVQNNENKCFGGNFLFNNLGLTTQVPTVIEVLNNKSSYNITIGKTRVRYVRIRPRISKASKDLIMMLEVLKNISTIPDSSMIESKNWLFQKMDKMAAKEVAKLGRIARDYSPKVRALLGCMFEVLEQNQVAKTLKKSLNQNSTFKVGLIAEHLTNAKEWRLKN